MPVLAPPPAPVKAQRRRRALEPYLQRLGTWVDGARPAGPAPLFDPGLLPEIQELESSDDPSDAESADLLRQCLALELKIADDSGRLKEAETEGTVRFYALQAELMLDSAVGLALQRELQRLVDELVRRGGVAMAKRLSRYLHRLRRVVSDAQQTMAESERARATAWVDELTDHPPAQGPPGDPRMEFLGRAAARRHSLLERERPLLGWTAVRLPTRRELLVGFLGLNLVLWLLIVLLPRFTEPAPVLLTRTDFTRAAPILALEARPPSLYLTLDPAEWDRSSDSTRARLVDAVASVLLVHEYQGAFLMAPDGRPLAQWLAGRGTRVLSVEQAGPPVPDSARVPGFTTFVP